MNRLRFVLVAAAALGALWLSLGTAGCKKAVTQEQLVQQANKHQEENDFVGAVQVYEEIVRRFPKSQQAPQCQFMVGYLYSNHLKNIEKAKEAYRIFIKKWPEHELIKDAQWELDHLGMDVNQIEELNKILGKDTLATARSDTAK